MSVYGEKKTMDDIVQNVFFVMNYYYYALHKTAYFMVFCMRILFHKFSKKSIIWLCLSALQMKKKDEEEYDGE